LSSVLQLQAEHFDTVINLEKVPGLCALADQITAWRRYGFRFDVKTGEADAYDGTQNALFLCRNENEKKNHNRYWQKHLFEMVGSTWNQEEYILGYRAVSEEKFDIGFNCHVGNKWPLKSWPMDYWQELERLIGDQYSVSWQQGLEDMEEYFEWINSCRLIITNDSFGLHLAIALKKKLVCLFGPTHHSEHYLYGLGESLYPEDFVCEKFPCRVDKCLHFEDTCMRLVRPDVVLDKIGRLLKKNKRKRP
jgi:heptosyltransferase-2